MWVKVGITRPQISPLARRYITYSPDGILNLYKRKQSGLTVLPEPSGPLFQMVIS